MDFPAPKPPQWAVAAGLPSPADGETFIEYVLRLGLDASALCRGLTPVTAELVNARLATLLQRELPADYRLHVRGLVAKHVPENRQWWLEHFQV